MCQDWAPDWGWSAEARDGDPAALSEPRSNLDRGNYDHPPVSPPAGGAWAAGASLATVAVAGSLLTLGLAQRRGEVSPR